MNIKDACNVIKSCHFEPLVSHGFLTPAKRGGFCCTAPNCSNGTGKDATGNVPYEYNGHWVHKCFVCGDSANNLDIIARHYQLNLDDRRDFIEAVKLGCDIFGIELDSSNRETGYKRSESPYNTSSSQNDTFTQSSQQNASTGILDAIRADLILAKKNLSTLPEKARRGLSLDTLRQFGCGYIPNWIHPKLRLAGTFSTPTPRLIIPAGDHYLARLTVPIERFDEKTRQYIREKQHAGTKSPFNIENITVDTLTIITEGEIDAMSIAQVSANFQNPITVTATGGAANYHSFIQTLQSYSFDDVPRFLILFDSDETGRLNAPKFVTELLRLGYPAVVKFLSDNISKLDANDILQQPNGDKKLADKISTLVTAAQSELDALTKRKSLSILNQPQMIGLADYFTDGFQLDIETLRKYAERSTGFSNIDAVQIFTPGLYVVGGLAALGKTSWCWQLLHQIAKNGESCIYCSYEMSRLELFSKSVASELYQRDSQTTISSADIRLGAYSNTITEIIDEFKTSKADLRVLELRDESIDDLLNFLTPICFNSDKAPVVCLDYLQIVPNHKETAKAAIDDTVRKLKTFQRDTNTTFIVISSFNRMNYTQPVSFESFKESGNIEYSADVVWGFQFYCAKDLREGATAKNREIVEAAKKAIPRQVQLCCLKNRQGTNYNVFFQYYASNDLFVPCDESAFKESPKPQQSTTSFSG